MLAQFVVLMPVDIAGLQTETPDQLKKANDEARKGEKRKVVNRDAVCVISQGTLNDPTMIQEDPHAMYVATAVEIPTSNGGAVVGFCAADVAASKVMVGQFEDTRLRSKLLKHFTGMSLAFPVTKPAQNGLAKRLGTYQESGIYTLAIPGVYGSSRAASAQRFVHLSVPKLPNSTVSLKASKMGWLIILYQSMGGF